MLLEVVKYGTPVLRQKGTPVETITPAVKQLISDMFETMYASRGIGLAAQQVGQAVQVTVIDIRGVTDRPSSLEVDGRSVDPAEAMPMVLINPQLTLHGPPETGPEGCLSFPEIYADITRPDLIDVKALNEHGQPVQFRCGGLLSRAVQHETDHLHGILFIDRMTRDMKEKLRPELEDLQAETRANRHSR